MGGPAPATTVKVVLAAVLVTPVLLAAFIGLRPSEAQVCARVVELTPEGHPHPPDEALCLQVLQTQRTLELPWTYASRMRCYARAQSGGAFHDCGGELAHIHE